MTLLCTRTAIMKSRYLAGFLLLNLAPAWAQRYEVTPFIGWTSGGTMKAQIEEEQLYNRTDLADSGSFGVAFGFRYDDFGFDPCEGCAYVGFRWLRQNTHLKLGGTPLDGAGLGEPSIRIDRYLADFGYEWTVPDAPIIKPFLIGSLGAARLGGEAGNNTKFAFAIGAGVKVFPRPRWGFRFQAEYIPTVMHAEVQQIVCVGACLAIVGGGLLSQFQVSIGPTFRF